MSVAKQHIIHLPYFADSATLFSQIADQPWAIFLDSGYPLSQQGRFDIIVVDPVCTLVTHGEITKINCRGVITESAENPFDLVKQQLQSFVRFNLGSEFIELPFQGGAIGYFGYDLTRRLERLPVIAEDAEQIPELAVGIYEWAVIVDHYREQSFLVGCVDAEILEGLTKQFSQLPEPQTRAPFRVTSEIKSNMDKDFYKQAFLRIKQYLREGDCYQVNLAQRFAASCEGNSWLAYQLLRQLNAAPFSCYLNLPEAQILCSSPERFLMLKNGMVQTKPIKGTRPRKEDDFADQEQITALKESPKDRAENLMIVDLLRNDLGKTCKKGSVKVPDLFAVESYATVHHLVSTITGVLNADQHALDLLKSCFPGGSITGAPKIRAMEIIEELEPHRRGVYCGAIGYVGFNGDMDTNIAIRTLVRANGSIRFWAGGGIVNDSVLDEEYQECFDKAEALLNLLRQLTVR